MSLDLSIDELLTTTRSVRKRLDFDKPVPREVLMECLELALQAPTGSNAQGWQFVFVDDPEKKEALADIYRGFATPYLASEKPTYGDARDERTPLVMDSAKYLNEHLHEVPVMLIPCLEGRPDGAPAGMSAGFWGSLLPAAWSYMLACRARGLGTAWTTLHLHYETEIAALLGLPGDIRQGALIPTAYYTGDTFRPAARRPLADVLHVDHW